MARPCPERRVGTSPPGTRAARAGARPRVLELLELPADVVLLLASVVQAAQGLCQLSHGPVPLPPQVVAERPGRGHGARSALGIRDAGPTACGEHPGACLAPEAQEC